MQYETPIRLCARPLYVQKRFVLQNTSEKIDEHRRKMVLSDLNLNTMIQLMETFLELGLEPFYPHRQYFNVTSIVILCSIRD